MSLYQHYRHCVYLSYCGPGRPGETVGKIQNLEPDSLTFRSKCPCGHLDPATSSSVAFGKLLSASSSLSESVKWKPYFYLAGLL